MQTNVLYPVSSWNEAIVTASANLLNGIVAIVPSLLGAIVVLLIGWILAIWIKKFVKSGLAVVRFDAAASRMGIGSFLGEAGYHASPKEAVADIIKWFIIISFFLASLSILGLPVVADALNKIIGYTPKVIAAVLILTGGLLLADFLSNVMRGTLRTMQIGLAATLATFAKWVVIVFTILAVIRQLEIVPDLINILFTGVVAALALGFGLMVGLGGKDVANEIFRDWYNKVRR